MSDLIYVAATVGFFGVALGYVHACEALRGERK
jgi:hypothetical protein